MATVLNGWTVCMGSTPATLELAVAGCDEGRLCTTSKLPPFAPQKLIVYYIKTSATGTRTRVARVRAEYPNQLDYSGF
jgi:hypothetical protein